MFKAFWTRFPNVHRQCRGTEATQVQATQVVMLETSMRKTKEKKSAHAGSLLVHAGSFQNAEAWNEVIEQTPFAPEVDASWRIKSLLLSSAV